MGKVLLYLLLFIQLLFGDINIASDIINIYSKVKSSILDDKEPQWIKDYKSEDKNYYYFLGQSGSYSNKNQTQALNDARMDAIKQIVNYIGINVRSEHQISKQDMFGKYSINQKQDIKLLSCNRIDSLKEIKNAILQKSDHIVAYSMYRVKKDILTRKIEKNKIKNKEFQTFLNDLDRLVTNQQYVLASNKLYKIKDRFKCLSKDNMLLKELENRIKNGIKVFVYLNKKNFFKGDYLRISLSVNKSVFVYVFINHNHKIKMVFPNIIETNNFLDANQEKKLKKIKLKQFYVGKNSVIVYAFKNRLEKINQYINKDGYIINSKKEQLYSYISNFMDKHKASVNFTVKQSINKKKVCLKFNSNQSDKIFYKLKDIIRVGLGIRDMSISCNDSDYTIYFNYKMKREWDPELKNTYKNISFYFILKHNNEELYSTDTNSLSYLDDTPYTFIINTDDLRGRLEDDLDILVNQIKDN